jgi:hypothetical protein
VLQRSAVVPAAPAYGAAIGRKSSDHQSLAGESRGRPPEAARPRERRATIRPTQRAPGRPRNVASCEPQARIMTGTSPPGTPQTAVPELLRRGPPRATVIPGLGPSAASPDLDRGARLMPSPAPWPTTAVPGWPRSPWPPPASRPRTPRTSCRRSAPTGARRLSGRRAPSGGNRGAGGAGPGSRSRHRPAGRPRRGCGATGARLYSARSAARRSIPCWRRSR